MSTWHNGLGDESRISLTVNGEAVIAQESDTVATLLLRLGYRAFGRHPVTGAPRAPGCMMGVCFGCLCEIDGRPESQACLEPVREGMAVRLEGVPVPAAEPTQTLEDEPVPNGEHGQGAAT